MSEIEIMIRLLAACIAGGVIGYLRERGGKAAGLRTHILVCLGSALFTIVSIYMAMIFDNVDASRIASTVVSGIGFLGAGVIIQEGGAVRGITTAASIWAVAAIGVAVGCGMYFTTAFTTILTFIVLQLLAIVEKKYISPGKG